MRHEAIDGAAAYNGLDKGHRSVTLTDGTHAGISKMSEEKRRLWSLVVVLIVTGIVAGMLAPIRLTAPLWLVRNLPPFGLQRILIVPLFASTMAQSALIALWGVASAASPWKRLAGLVVGAVYLEMLLALGLDDEFVGTATVTIAVTSLSLLVLRAMKIRLARQSEKAQVGRAEPEGLRFSIRGLMVFTAAVAVLSAGVRALQASHGRNVGLAGIWALCFVAVGLSALWAALGQVNPLRRGLVVFVLSAVLGACFAVAAHAHEAGRIYILLTMLLYSAILMVSLLVIRSCNYRLVRRSSLPSAMSDTGTRVGCASLDGIGSSEAFSHD